MDWAPVLRLTTSPHIGIVFQWTNYQSSRKSLEFDAWLVLFRGSSLAKLIVVLSNIKVGYRAQIAQLLSLSTSLECATDLHSSAIIGKSCVEVADCEGHCC